MSDRPTQPEPYVCTFCGWRSDTHSPTASGCPACLDERKKREPPPREVRDDDGYPD